LGRGPDGETLDAVRGGGDGARFHRNGVETLTTDAFLDGVRGGGKGGIDIASAMAAEGGADIVFDLVVEVRGVVFHCGVDLGNGRKRVDIDHHHLGSIFGDRAGLGDDDGERVTDVADAFPGEGDHRGYGDIVSVRVLAAVLAGGLGGDVGEEAVEILAGDDVDDTRYLAGGFGVVPGDDAVWFQ